jgi:thiamine-monophosphate kinase
MIDISDGLLADLGHICSASGLRGVVRQSLLPLSPAARAAIAANPNLNTAVTSGGDDYELLLTAPAEAADAIAKASAAVGVPITAIGAMEKGEGIALLDATGRPVKVELKGYAHFS